MKSISINKVTIIGNITRNPEIRETAGGQTMASFGIATNRDWTSGTEHRQDVEFHQLVAWGKLAEICQQILEKGKLVYIEGYLKTRNWTNEDGTKSFRTEIIAEELILLSRNSKPDHQHNENTNPEQTQDENTFEG